MKLKQHIAPAAISVICFALDRLTKLWACAALTGGRVSVIPGILDWSLVRNTGVAFSMLSGKDILLILLTSVLILGIIMYSLFSSSLTNITRMGLGMIVGGGLGNLYDRLFLNGVVDFIRPAFFNFAIFNVADIFVCVGCILTLILIILSESKERK